MNQDIKAKWVTALRSGKYTRGKEFLQRNGRYCCLGVLCDIAASENVVTAAKLGNIVNYDNMRHVLPTAVLKWADIKTPFVYLDNPVKGWTSLTGLNDSSSATFAEIADVIETQL